MYIYILPIYNYIMTESLYVVLAFPELEGQVDGHAGLKLTEIYRHFCLPSASITGAHHQCLAWNDLCKYTF